MSSMSTDNNEIERKTDFGFKVSQYNNPNQRESEPLLKAIGDATEPFEAQSLAYKVIVAGALVERGILPDSKAGGQMIMGERIPFGEYFICVDVLDVIPDKGDILVRCLAKGERMSDKEYLFWETVAQHEKIQKVIFAHESELDPLEERFIKRLKELYQKVDLIHVPIS